MADISAQSILLDILTEYPAAVELIKEYDEAAGVCLCCEMLFATLAEIVEKFDLDRNELMSRLRSLATPP